MSVDLNVLTIFFHRNHGDKQKAYRAAIPIGNAKDKDESIFHETHRKWENNAIIARLSHEPI